MTLSFVGSLAPACISFFALLNVVCEMGECEMDRDVGCVGPGAGRCVECRGDGECGGLFATVGAVMGVGCR